MRGVPFLAMMALVAGPALGMAAPILAEWTFTEPGWVAAVVHVTGPSYGFEYIANGSDGAASTFVTSSDGWGAYGALTIWAGAELVDVVGLGERLAVDAPPLLARSWSVEDTMTSSCTLPCAYDLIVTIVAGGAGDVDWGLRILGDGTLLATSSGQSAHVALAREFEGDHVAATIAGGPLAALVVDATHSFDVHGRLYGLFGGPEGAVHMETPGGRVPCECAWLLDGAGPGPYTFTQTGPSTREAYFGYFDVELPSI